MYSKAMLFEDYDVAKMIMKTVDPKQIKSFGRMVRGFDSNTWDKNKERIVYEANLAKFSQNEELKSALLSTADKLIVEASPYDNIWGIGLDESDERVLDDSRWLGLNLLGKAIMKVRDELRK